MSDNFTCFGVVWNPYVDDFGNQNKVPVVSECGADATLRLDSPCSYNPKCPNFIGVKRKWCKGNGTDRDCEHATFALSLSHSSTSSDISKGSSATAFTVTSSRKIYDEESSGDLGLNFQFHFGNGKAFSPTKHTTDASTTTEVRPMFDLQLSLSTGLSESVCTNITTVSCQQQNSIGTAPFIPVKADAEGGSASSAWKLHSYPLPSHKTSESINRFSASPKISRINSLPAVPDILPTITAVMKSSVTCTSGNTYTEQRSDSNKNCQFQGCTKGARGASGLCIAHGGGRRCQKIGCQKGAEGKTVYCKAHGGGRRCQYLGCTKSAEGRTDYCIAHGGGRRCSNEGCTRAARGKSGLCIRHGGGKRCQKENCTKSAEGFSGLCISHGGGRRCRFPACTKGAQGSTMLCKAHGGGKRCTLFGCTKGAEGSTPFCKGHGGGKRCSFQDAGVCSKSVHGGTQFCVAHGGGKRCVFPDCTKSARGRTDYCVRHGGGKRCTCEGCGKSAQGSTDFCKAHGGGKRCSWGQPGSRGKVALCCAHGALVQDHCIHGGGRLQPPSALQLKAPVRPEVMKEVPSEDLIISKTWSRVDSSAIFSSADTIKSMHIPVSTYKPKLATLPEGRVHGGCLMAFLSSCPDTGKSSSSQELVATSEQMPFSMMHKWI